MKKSIVFIGSSAGDAKIAKVMSVLHDAKIDVETFCISTDDVSKVVKDLKKCHKKMMDTPEVKTEKKKAKKAEKEGKNKPAKAPKKDADKKQGKEPKPKKAKKGANFEKLAKLTGAKTKKQKQELKKQLEKGIEKAVSNITDMPLGAIDDIFDNMEDFFEYVDIRTND